MLYYRVCTFAGCCGDQSADKDVCEVDDISIETIVGIVISLVCLLTIGVFLGVLRGWKRRVAASQNNRKEETDRKKGRQVEKSTKH